MRCTGNMFITPTPEKMAARELQSMRLMLFQAERRLVAAQMQVAYYRNLIAFLREVATARVEDMADGSCAPSQEIHPSDACAALGLTTVPSAA